MMKMKKTENLRQVRNPLVHKRMKNRRRMILVKMRMSLMKKRNLRAKLKLTENHNNKLVKNAQTTRSFRGTEVRGTKVSNSCLTWKLMRAMSQTTLAPVLAIKVHTIRRESSVERLEDWVRRLLKWSRKSDRGKRSVRRNYWQKRRNVGVERLEHTRMSTNQ